MRLCFVPAVLPSRVKHKDVFINLKLQVSSSSLQRDVVYLIWWKGKVLTISTMLDLTVQTNLSQGGKWL